MLMAADGSRTVNIGALGILVSQITLLSFQVNGTVLGDTSPGAGPYQSGDSLHADMCANMQPTASCMVEDETLMEQVFVR